MNDYTPEDIYGLIYARYQAEVLHDDRDAEALYRELKNEFEGSSNFEEIWASIREYGSLDHKIYALKRSLAFDFEFWEIADSLVYRAKSNWNLIETFKIDFSKIDSKVSITFISTAQDPSTVNDMGENMAIFENTIKTVFVNTQNKISNIFESPSSCEIFCDLLKMEISYDVPIAQKSLSGIRAFLYDVARELGDELPPICAPLKDIEGEALVNLVANEMLVKREQMKKFSIILSYVHEAVYLEIRYPNLPEKIKEDVLKRVKLNFSGV